MSRANDRAVPVGHHDIVSILETVRARAIANALLALLQFFQEAEIPWYWRKDQSDHIV